MSLNKSDTLITTSCASVKAFSETLNSYARSTSIAKGKENLQGWKQHFFTSFLAFCILWTPCTNMFHESVSAALLITQKVGCKQKVGLAIKEPLKERKPEAQQPTNFHIAYKFNCSQKEKHLQDWLLQLNYLLQLFLSKSAPRVVTHFPSVNCMNSA